MVGAQHHVLLEGVLWCDHEPHPIESLRAQHVLGNGHVPNVRGIEGAEETADVHLSKKVRTICSAAWQARCSSSFTTTLSKRVE